MIYIEVHIDYICTCTGLSNCCFKIMAFSFKKPMQDSLALSGIINNPTIRRQLICILVVYIMITYIISDHTRNRLETSSITPKLNDTLVIHYIC